MMILIPMLVLSATMWLFHRPSPGRDPRDISTPRGVPMAFAPAWGVRAGGTGEVPAGAVR